MYMCEIYIKRKNKEKNIYSCVKYTLKEKLREKYIFCVKYTMKGERLLAHHPEN